MYRRKLIAGAVSVVVLLGGIATALAATQGGASVAADETCDISFNPGLQITCLDFVSPPVATTDTCEIALGSGLRVTCPNVVVPPPTTTEPPPTTTEPPPSGACTVDDTSGCVPGSILLIRDNKWFCNRPISSYGDLPLKVVVSYSEGFVGNANGAIDLYTGCQGDADPQTIDLIIDVQATATKGNGHDAVKTRIGPRNIQATGRADCGPRAPGAHQDGFQFQGGSNITFVDFEIGNYDAGLSSCQGAGGAFFYSSAQGINAVRGKFIACNHSLLAAGAQGHVKDAKFRSGRTDGSDPRCVGFYASNPCIPGTVTTENITCERWIAGRWQPR